MIVAMESAYTGLTQEEAEQRLKKYGPNVIERRKKRTAIQIIIEQLLSPLITILIVAAIISWATGSGADAAVILGIIAANTAIGTYQELKAEKAMEELQKLTAPKARVIRDGKIVEIPAKYVVPGDLILVSAGDIVPADAVVVESHGLQVNESLLTGEAYPVEKHACSKGVSKGCQEVSAMIFAGTYAVRGSARALVVATGRSTKMGEIGALLDEDYGKSAAQEEMDRLGRYISAIVLGIAAVVFSILYVKGTGLLTAGLVAIALAVAAVPEGLPVVVTITMALGARSMAEDGVIVRRLSAIQDLGTTDTICTDKTGTITENRLRVAEFHGDPEVRALAGACTDPNAEDPVDSAVAAWSGGESQQTQIIKPFSEEWGYMEAEAQYGGRSWRVIKGAPESVLSIIPSVENGRKIIEIARAMAERGLKPIAVVATDGSEYKLGAIGLQDPIRPGVREAVERARAAGIRTIVITGDHPETARAVAEAVGIPADRVVTGEKIDAASDAELRALVERVNVFARIRPEQKLRIVTALRANGHRVAMTGDGVNDAPALKAADVGIAMGTGSDVAKSAADVILSNNGYENIVHAIMWGRRVINNIKSSVTYLLSANTAEVVGVFVGSLFDWVIMRPVQILWLNLVSDGPPSLALTTDPAPKNVERMRPGEFAHIITGDALLRHIILFGTTIGLALVTIYALNAENVAVAQTAVLTGFVIMEAVRMQTVRGSPIWTNRLVFWTVLGIIALQLALVYTPAGSILGLVPLGATDLLEIGAVVAAVYAMSRFFSI